MSCNSHRLVRKYRPEDRDAVRWICCQTGMLGHPIDPVFQDRELFADYLTSYYTDMEPESCFVVEHRGKVVGYYKTLSERIMAFGYFAVQRCHTKIHRLDHFPWLERDTRSP